MWSTAMPFLTIKYFEASFDFGNRDPKTGEVGLGLELALEGDVSEREGSAGESEIMVVCDFCSGLELGMAGKVGSEMAM